MKGDQASFQNLLLSLFYPKTAEINRLSDLAKTYFAQINMFYKIFFYNYDGFKKEKNSSNSWNLREKGCDVI